MAKKKEEETVKEEKTTLQEVVHHLKAAHSHCCELTHDGLGRTADVLNEVQRALKPVALYVNNPPKGKPTVKETKGNSAALEELKAFREEMVKIAARPAAMVVALRQKDRTTTKMSPKVEMHLNRLILAVTEDVIENWTFSDSHENKDI